MRAEYSLSSLAEALGVERMSISRRAAREGWPFRIDPSGRSHAKKVRSRDLPADIRAALSGERSGKPVANRPAAVPGVRSLSASARESGQARAALLLAAAERAESEGIAPSQALEIEASARGVAPGTARRWRSRAKGLPPSEWAAALAERRGGSARSEEIDPRAWDFFASHYLSRSKPTLAEAARRTREAAAANGWGGLPSEATLRRRLAADVSAASVEFLREGAEASAASHPPQRRDRSAYLPGEAVVGDGLKFDRLRVLWPDGEIVATATAWCWSDLRTNRILAARAAKTETMDLFRLSTYDLAGECGPRLAWIDNTMVVACKPMTGGAKGRRRGAELPSDPPGLLQEIGIVPRWTDPGRHSSPGSKPIERSFGIGGLHELVATNPAFDSRGHSRARPVPLAEFEKILACEVARFNAREKRRTAECRGVLSFDQAWAELRDPERFGPVCADKRALLLLVPERVRADKRTGEVRIRAGRGPLGRHRYWVPALGEFKGRELVARYDPADLLSGIDLYGLDGRFVVRAAHLGDEGFGDTDAAREWAKNKRRHAKAVKTAALAEKRLGSLELKAAYPLGGEAVPAPGPAAPKAPRPAAGPSAESDRLDAWLAAEFDPAREVAV